MSEFWQGFIAAWALYFTFGFVVGVVIVLRYLPRFFAAGWRWRVMTTTIITATIGWPALLIETMLESMEPVEMPMPFESTEMSRDADVNERERSDFQRATILHPPDRRPS